MDEGLEKTLPLGAQRPSAKKRELRQPRGLVDAPQVASESPVGLRDDGVRGEPAPESGIGGDLAGTDAQQDAGAGEPDDAGTRGGDAQPEVVVLGDRDTVPAGLDEGATPGERGGVRVGVVEQQREPTGHGTEGDRQRGQAQPGSDDLERREHDVGTAIESGHLGAEPAGQTDVVRIHPGDDLTLGLVEQQGESARDAEVLGRDGQSDATIAETADELGRSVARRIVEHEHLGIVGQGREGRAEGGSDRPGGVPRGHEDAQAGHADSFPQGGINPVVNPPLRAGDPTTGQIPVPSLEQGTTRPEGTPMLRTPGRAAPRHAPRIRIGCDVHPISEIAESIELFGERYLRRVFTPIEREQTAGPMALERLAGRYAAKEAVLKVLRIPSTAAVPWQAIEVRTGRNGVPFVVLSGPAAALAEKQGISRIDISLSHDGGVAMAVAAAIPDEADE